MRLQSKSGIDTNALLTSYLREQMVNNVVLDDAMEEMASNKAKVSVHCCKGSLDKCPVLCIKMRHVGVSMVQVGDSDLI